MNKKEKINFLEFRLHILKGKVSDENISILDYKKYMKEIKFILKELKQLDYIKNTKK